MDWDILELIEESDPPWPAASGDPTLLSEPALSISGNHIAEVERPTAVIGQQPETPLVEEEDWSQIQDMGERRRIQNRNAQRIYRARRKRAKTQPRIACVEDTGVSAEKPLPTIPYLPQSPSMALETDFPLALVHESNFGTRLTAAAAQDSNDSTGSLGRASLETRQLTPANLDLHNNHIAATQAGARPANTSIANNHHQDRELPDSPLESGRVRVAEIKRSALHLAVENGHFQIVKMLLERNGDYAMRDSDGQTALHLAARKGHLQILIGLLGMERARGGIVSVDRQAAREANRLIAVNPQRHCPTCSPSRPAARLVDMRDRNGQTALHIALEVGCEEIVRELLRAKANPNLQDSGGLTALHIAGARGDEHMVRVLLEHGADPQVQIDPRV